MPWSGFVFFSIIRRSTKGVQRIEPGSTFPYTPHEAGAHSANMTELSGNSQVVIPTSFIIRAVAEGRISFHSLLGRNTPLHRKQEHMLDADKRKEAHRESLQRGRKGAFLLQLGETQHHGAMLV